jgi:hypothetical protein
MPLFTDVHEGLPAGTHRRGSRTGTTGRPEGPGGTWRLGGTAEYQRPAYRELHSLSAAGHRTLNL